MSAIKTDPLEVVTARVMIEIQKLTIWLGAGYGMVFVSCFAMLLLEHGKRNTLIIVAVAGGLGLLIGIISSIRVAILHFRMIDLFARNEIGRITRISAEHRHCACWCRIMRDKRSTTRAFLHPAERTALAKAVEHFAKHKVATT